MHIVTITAPVFATNCYLISAEASGLCVIVDPGGGVAPLVRRELESRGLEPGLILATHGHVDHTWAAADLGRDYDIPLRLHAADAYRLSDPFGTLEHGNQPDGDLTQALASGPLGHALAAVGCAPGDYEKPARVETFDGAVTTWQTAGLTITAIHAPGHTEGSTIFTVDSAPSEGSILPFGGSRFADHVTRTALTGDVLFAGSIGRTDLPGGDGAAMARTLRDTVANLAPDSLVLPGHGPASRMREELVTNPFLAHR